MLAVEILLGKAHARTGTQRLADSRWVVLATPRFVLVRRVRWTNGRRATLPPPPWELADSGDAGSASWHHRFWMVEMLNRAEGSSRARGTAMTRMRVDQVGERVCAISSRQMETDCLLVRHAVRLRIIFYRIKSLLFSPFRTTFVLLFEELCIIVNNLRRFSSDGSLSYQNVSSSLYVKAPFVFIICGSLVSAFWNFLFEHTRFFFFFLIDILYAGYFTHFKLCAGDYFWRLPEVHQYRK